MDSSVESIPKPKTLICYLCGREFGTASLTIHHKSCIKLWEEREKLKPEKDRRPVPVSPCEIPKNFTLKEISEHNETANETWKMKSMIKCPHCDRKFLEDRFAIHQRGCTAETPSRAVRQSLMLNKVLINDMTNECSPTSQTPKSARIINNSESLLSPSPRILTIETPKSRLNTSHGNKKTCELCNKKFEGFLIEQHKKTCIKKTEAALNELKLNLTVENEELVKISKSQPMIIKNREISVLVVECPICKRKFDPKLIERHIPKCKEIEERNQSPAKRFEAPKLNRLLKSQTMSANKFSITAVKYQDIVKISNPQEVESDIKKEKIFCHICGEKYLSNANFCAYCGIRKD